MRKLYLITSFLSFFLFAFGAPKLKKEETWIDATVKAKSTLRSQLQKTNMPVSSRWVKKNEKAEPFVVDLRNSDKLILIQQEDLMVQVMIMQYGETLV